MQNKLLLTHALLQNALGSPICPPAVFVQLPVNLQPLPGFWNRCLGGKLWSDTLMVGKYEENSWVCLLL